MLKICVAFVFINICFLVGLNCSVKAQQVPNARWIVKVRAEHVPALRTKFQRSNLTARFSTSLHDGFSRIAILQDSHRTETFNWLSELQLKGEIEFFEPDYVGKAASIKVEIPNDALFSQQWYLSNDGSLQEANAVENADINIPEAWSVTQGDSNLIIAILDSGVSFLEPELEGRLWTNANEIPDDMIDNDKNGYVDDVNGYDFTNNKSSPEDDNGHGTAIAGIIGAATNNEIGIAGINPSSKLMICKVLNNNLTGNYSDWIEGIHYAIANGASIINMSVIGNDNSKLLQEAIIYAHAHGVTIFCSMGNENNSENRYPAAYPETVSVGSSNADDQRSASFSNYGNYIDVLAPGNRILGLHEVPGETVLWTGTSMSSAVACGVGSLLLSYNPSLTPDELQSILIETSKDGIGSPEQDVPGWDRYYGFGRIDAFLALDRLSEGQNAENLFTLAVYPNPTSGRILAGQIILGNLDPVRLDVVDLQGKLMKSMRYEPESRTFAFSISLTDYSDALYFLRVSTSHDVYLKRFILN